MSDGWIHRQWQLKWENGIKYWIEIKDFRERVCEPQHIGGMLSDMFKIGESVFKIQIHATAWLARTACDGDWSYGVFLENLNDWMVRCAFTFTAGDLKFESCPGTFMPKDSAGSFKGDPDFVTLDKIDGQRVLNDDGRLVLEVDVHLLKEEVVATWPEKEIGKELPELERELSSVREQLAKMEVERDRIWLRTKEEIDAVKSDMKQLLIRERQNEEKSGRTEGSLAG